MVKSQINNNLIDATKKIVTQFGKNIIHEERFVNVLSDLSPERNAPAVFKITKSAIQDDLLKPVLNADIKSIEHIVAATTSTLSKQYGYDQLLVESILFSLAVGYGTITTVQYNALKAQNNNSPKKQTSKPVPNNNPNSNQPNKNNRKNNNSNKRGNSINFITIKQSAALIWGVFGLLVSPIAYSLLICQARWWPLPTSLVIALIHFFTLIPVSIAFDKYSYPTQHQNQALQGASCALFLFAILFWILFPFLFSIQYIQSYLGFFSNDESFPLIITIGFNLFCAGILSSYLDDNMKIWGNVKKQLQSPSSRKGFLIIVSIFLLVAVTIFSRPIIGKVKTKYIISKYNNKITVLNLHKDSLKNERCKIERNLSFAQFKLGDSFSACLSKINDGDKNTINKETCSNNLFVNEVNYIAIVDTNLHFKTAWNNETIDIDLYFTNHKTIAIKLTSYKTNADSLIASYTAKYGEPEYRILEYVEPDFDLPYYLYNSDVEEYMKNRMISKEFYWTYKNCLIYIDNNSGSHTTMYDTPTEGKTITYFDRAAEHIFKLYKAEQDRKKSVYEQRRKDSLKLVRDSLKLVRKAKERLRQEQRRQKELNHQRSMEQI